MFFVRAARVALVLALFAAAPASLHSQSIKDRVKAKTQTRTEEVKEQGSAKLDAIIEKALDDIENAAKCVLGDDQCAADAKTNGQKVVVTDDNGKILPPAQQPAGSPAKNADAVVAANKKAAGEDAPAAETAEPVVKAAEPASKPGDAAWQNYDFVPGERVLFADDFARDRVGNFPQRLELIQGNLQIVEAAGARWVQSTSLEGELAVPLPEVLPARFTVEFDFTFANNFPIAVYSGSKPTTEELGDGSVTSFAYFGNFTSGLHANGRNMVQVNSDVGGKTREDLSGTAARARIQVDGKYVKVYINENRIANVPNADFVHGNKLFIRLPWTEGSNVMVGNISVNAGGRDMYDALMADGRVVTQGIFFDVGSDRIRPESTPTLKIIGDMLTAHADLNLTVEGHTDNTGVASSNQTLSEKRAQAIVAALTSTYGVAASRLTAVGFGASKPAKPNDTPEGRQQNRRVELVRK